MIMRSLLFLACLHLSTSCLCAELILLTTDATETIGGITIRNGDIAKYDTMTDTATLAFNEDLFTANETIDAFQMLTDGTFLISTSSAATLGGVSFTPDDIVSYNPRNGFTEIVFNGDDFAANENIDAFYRFDDGTWLISTVGNATLGGLTFRDGDLALYNEMTNIATLFFDEDVFAANEDIDGVYAITPDILRFTTLNNATLDGTLFEDGDVIEYTISTGVATTVLDESLFGGAADINGISAIPEPQLDLIANLALLACLAWRRR